MITQQTFKQRPHSVTLKSRPQLKSEPDGVIIYCYSKQFTKHFFKLLLQGLKPHLSNGTRHHYPNATQTKQCKNTGEGFSFFILIHPLTNFWFFALLKLAVSVCDQPHTFFFCSPVTQLTPERPSWPNQKSARFTFYVMWGTALWYLNCREKWCGVP